MAVHLSAHGDAGWPSAYPHTVVVGGWLVVHAPTHGGGGRLAGWPSTYPNTVGSTSRSLKLSPNSMTKHIQKQTTYLGNPGLAGWLAGQPASQPLSTGWLAGCPPTHPRWWCWLASWLVVHQPPPWRVRWTASQPPSHHHRVRVGGRPASHPPTTTVGGCVDSQPATHHHRVRVGGRPASNDQRVRIGGRPPSQPAI